MSTIKFNRPTYKNKLQDFLSNTLEEFFSLKLVKDKIGPKYKVYTALVDQFSTDAPQVTVLENTLGFSVNWVRNSAGVYTANLGGSIGEKKTFIVIGSPAYTATDITASWIASTQIRLTTRSISGDPTVFTNSDDKLYNTAIEIRVYP